MIRARVHLCSSFRWSSLAAKKQWKWMRWRICLSWSKPSPTLIICSFCMCKCFISYVFCIYREVCESSVLLNLKKRFQRDSIYVSFTSDCCKTQITWISKTSLFFSFDVTDNTFLKSMWRYPLGYLYVVWERHGHPLEQVSNLFQALNKFNVRQYFVNGAKFCVVSFCF